MPFAPTLLWLLLAQAAPVSTGSLEELRTLLREGAHERAREVGAALVEREPQNAQAWLLYGSALHASGEYRPALEAFGEAAAFPATRTHASYNAACASSLAGDVDRALAWLGAAFDAGFLDLELARTDPDLAALRDDPRAARVLPVKGEPARFREPVKVLLELRGEAPNDQFGWIARNVGDADGDGVNDLVSSAPFHAQGAGRVVLVSGKTGQTLFTWDGAPGEQLGLGVEGAGDVDADGRPDVVAGAPGVGAGKAYVWSGRTGERLLALSGDAAGDGFGRKVAGAGDLDGDGHAEVLIGAPNHDGLGPDAGRVTCFSGASGEPLFAIDGDEPGDHLGNCDGIARGEQRMVAVGAPDAGPGDRGRVTVFRVVDGEPEPLFAIEPGAEDVDLGRMFLSFVGDVDGDGVVDVYASDWASNAGGRPGAGRVVVHSGKDGRRLHAWAGEAPGDGFGIGTAEAGDLDGDGCDDLVIGAWQSDAGARGAGRCVLLSGRTGERLGTLTCTNPCDTFGFDATGLGDVDGDGRPDLLVTSAYSFVNGPRSGRTLVLSPSE